MSDKQEAEQLGEPVAYLVVKGGTPVFEASGARAGEVEHVVADEQDDVFHGLIVKTHDGHRFAPASAVEGLYERGVIISVPAAGLPEPSADPAAAAADGHDDGLAASLKRAWEWIVRPR